MQKFQITEDHIYELKGEALRTYLWFNITGPEHGMELTHSEMADNLNVSQRTVQRAVYELVDKGYLEREYVPGFVPTYKVVK